MCKIRLAGFFWLAVVACLLSSCASQSDTALPFPNTLDFKQEVARLKQLNPTVEKTITKGGVSETHSAKLDWETELSVFLEADINKPNYRDAYQVAEEHNGHATTFIYTANEESLPVKEALYSFENGQCNKVVFHRALENLSYRTEQVLTYEPGAGYRIESAQHVPTSFDDAFTIDVRFHEDLTALWAAELDLGEAKLPFSFNLMQSGGRYHMQIINGAERIDVREISLRDDSIFIRLPVFASEIRGSFSSTAIAGIWQDYSRGNNYAIPFRAQKGTQRFRQAAFASVHPNVNGRWKAEFSQGTEDAYDAVSVFEQDGGRLTGTFLTETGDYRYLEGNAWNDSLMLSCFDGAHAFLFKARLDKHGQLHGTFWSGSHWKEPWVAVRSSDFELVNPDSLTFLKPGYDKFGFSFPNLQNKNVSLSDKRFSGKPVIIQIMGSWCPNCADETALLAKLYRTNKDRGLEVVALAFEKTNDLAEATQRVKKHREHFGAEYEFLIAGNADKKSAAEKLPMLNHIVSYPTTIFIDKKGSVRRIYTGFYGPGTGEHYQRFVKDITAFTAQLLNE